MITAEEATRRVLVLENPKLRGKSRITQSLYAGFQLILPGEIAPPHRHSPAAIRFILDGEGAYTQVDGEKTIMQPGDFVHDADWTIHDHGNKSKKPMIWLDVLDVPTVNFFETSFYEHFDYETAEHPARQRGLAGALRFGRAAGRLRDASLIAARSSTIPTPRCGRSCERLRADRRHRSAPRRALPLRQPVDGGWVMPTMGAHLSLLPKGFKGKDYQATDCTIFVCVEGEGTTKVGGQTLEWGPKDVFVVPSWMKHSHQARRSRCCSRSPTVRRRRRSAFGAKRSELNRPFIK